MIRTPAWALFLVALGCTGAPTTQTTPTPEPAPAPEPAPEPVAEPKPTMDIPPERAVQVITPTGEVTADKVTAPAEGTVEYAIVKSITLLSAGDFDAWIKDWCHESVCGTPEGTLSMKSYTLPAAQGTSKQCLGVDGNSVIVTRRDPVEADGLTRVYVYCGDKRMPAPSAHYLVDGKYKVTSLSW